MEIERPAIFSPEQYDAAEAARIVRLQQNSQQPIPDPDSWLDEELKRNVFLTTVDFLFDQARARSTFPFLLGLACCALEMMSAGMSRFDFTRWGLDIARWSPRQADLMIVAGTLTWKMAPAVRTLYDQMAEPKWVIAMGVCAISGGTFRESYSVVPGVNRIIPVDVYIPGCPPRPEALIYGINLIQQKILKDSLLRKHD